MLHRSKPAKTIEKHADGIYSELQRPVRLSWDLYSAEAVGSDALPTAGRETFGLKSDVLNRLTRTIEEDPEEVDNVLYAMDKQPSLRKRVGKIREDLAGNITRFKVVLK